MAQRKIKKAPNTIRPRTPAPVKTPNPRVSPSTPATDEPKDPDKSPFETTPSIEIPLGDIVAYADTILPSKYVEIIKLRYGYNDGQRLTVPQVAHELNISRRRVYEIEQYVLRKWVVYNREQKKHFGKKYKYFEK